MLHPPLLPTMGRLTRLLLLLLPLAAALLAAPRPAAAQARGPIYTVELDGVVSRYSVGYLRRALREAEAAGAETIVVRLGASGAVLSEVRAVAAEVANAGVPVVLYVAPAGTRSGAAGTWLLPAAHIAAMAPDTSFGIPAPLVAPDPSLSEATRELLRAEAINQLGGWSRERGRGDAWVEQAVRQGA
ncbi:MAG TPA: nodulation protein NfeD, partial [Chloroflexaceae bacterium]|nr:nodulation protein NfeD [Chloroflexaceae bacterium]